MPLIRVKFKDRTFNIEIDFSRCVDDLFEYLSQVVDIDGQNCRLILGGRVFLPMTASSVADSSTRLAEIVKPNGVAMLLASSPDELAKIFSFKPDPLLKNIDAEIRDHENRLRKTIELRDENPWGLAAEQDEEYRFDRFEVQFKRNVPPPFDAEKLLKKLATDPAIVQIMRTRRFKVGTLCELDPLDADIEQAQKGEGEKCLLGWNRNFGQRIALRLRTDDFKSFRSYDSIITTLVHELVHNVYGEHDDSFWRLFNELHDEYRRLHLGRKHASRAQEMAPLNSVSPYTPLLSTQRAQKLQVPISKPSSKEGLREARLASLDRRTKK